MSSTPDMRSYRYKVRIVALGREQYTGKIAKVAFVNGQSVNFVSYQEAMSVCAVTQAEVAWDLGEGELDFGPLSPALIAAMSATEREEGPRETVATPVALPDIEPFAVKEIGEPEYDLTDADAGYLINFTQGCQIGIPDNLKDGFYCSLRQGSSEQISVYGYGYVDLVEIDDNYYSEKRYAILHLARFPDGGYQLTGRTGPAQEIH